MKPLVTGHEMRAMDRKTIDEIGVPAALLMEHAGRSVAYVARARAHGRVVVVCGSGNNGGDGFVCARWLREHGVDARVYLAKGRPKGADAAMHLALYEKLGGPVETEVELEGASVIVDALLGTGLTQAVTGELAALIEKINASRAVKIAVDIPSGMHTDTGAVMGACVRADVTVTLGFAKVGLASHPGVERAGELVVADIGIPHALARGVTAFLFEESDAVALVPHRDLGGHKGTFGHVVVAAGSAGKVGAALLSTMGALRTGAGLVTLATPPAAAAAVLGKLPESMHADFDPEANDAEAVLRKLVEGKKALVWGPGMPTSDAAGRIVKKLAVELELPIVLDADALNHLGTDVASLARAHGPRILTPHPGEAARLLGSDVKAVQADRIAAARKLAATAKAVVVLKGARSVVAAPDGTVSLNPSGNPGMGSGGMGDVLSGILGALLAQGMAPLEATRLGVYAHGLAGDRVAAARGTIGLIAGDLAAEMPAALASLSRPAGQTGNDGRVSATTRPQGLNPFH